MRLSKDPKNNTFSSLETDYTPKYSSQLEAAYGPGMLSEGAEEGIESLFDYIPLENKTALDIGSGLGGVAFYLANHYQMKIMGLEVNAWMVSEAKKRIPPHLKDRVNFLLSTSNSNWPFADKSFDLIYSKGVLTHLKSKSKEEIFHECYRLLKNDGLLIIVDWLSSEEKKWGKNLQKLIDLEPLMFYPESRSGYIKALEQNGFTVLAVREDSEKYVQYNLAIVDRLKDPFLRHTELKCFNDEELASAIEGYLAIAQAMQNNEVHVYRFVAKK